AAIALPLYNGYINTSREGALLSNMATTEVFEEDYRLRTGTYIAGAFDGTNPDAGMQTLGWQPQDKDGTKYTIVLSGGSYKVTATDKAGTTVCRQYPEKIAC